jgi:hypothetical protein
MNEATSARVEKRLELTRCFRDLQDGTIDLT